MMGVDSATAIWLRGDGCRLWDDEFNQTDMNRSKTNVTTAIPTGTPIYR